MTEFYAGIGARATPSKILLLMGVIAVSMRRSGIWLRSGGAKGADTAFETEAWDRKEIFRPQDATLAALELSARFHPKWSACSGDARLKHARNAMIILGRDLDTPVERVVCWTPGGGIVGGTGQALRIALAYGIPISNLATPHFDQLELDLYAREPHDN